MTAHHRQTASSPARTRVRAVAVPESFLPLSGIIILLGLTFAILRLIITG